MTIIIYGNPHTAIPGTHPRFCSGVDTSHPRGSSAQNPSLCLNQIQNRGFILECENSHKGNTYILCHNVNHNDLFARSAAFACVR